MSKVSLLGSTLNTIFFGIILAVAGPIVLGYLMYQWLWSSVYDSSSISFNNECQGRVIGANDAMNKFVFYNEEQSGRSILIKLCVMDRENGAQVFYDHPEGYKNKRALGISLTINSRFSPLPSELAALFRSAELPRFQFNSQALIIVRHEYQDRLEAAMIPYDELGLVSKDFGNWPTDTFSGFSGGPKVNYSRLYYDDNEYQVSVTNDDIPITTFNIRLDKTPGYGVVFNNHILIPLGQEVAVFDFHGKKLSGDFCCVDRLRLMPGNSNWLLSEGDGIKLWQAEDIGL